jgi:hypothetical protein
VTCRRAYPAPIRQWCPHSNVNQAFVIPLSNKRQKIVLFVRVRACVHLCRRSRRARVTSLSERFDLAVPDPGRSGHHNLIYYVTAKDNDRANLDCGFEATDCDGLSSNQRPEGDAQK